jgi:hypothetical protein
MASSNASTATIGFNICIRKPRTQDCERSFLLIYHDVGQYKCWFFVGLDAAEHLACKADREIRPVKAPTPGQ